MTHLSKWQKTLMILAICATNLAVMADFIIVPVANDLFMEYDEFLVNYILSGPSLVQIAGGFLAGMIMTRFGSKKTLTVSFALFTICGLIMSFYNTAIALAVFRSIAAFAIAVINATSMAIIANTMDPSVIGTIMGIYNASMALMGVLLSFFSGRLAATSWTNVFKLYWLSIPVLVMIILFIKENPNAAETDLQEESAGLEYGNPIIFVLAYFVFNLLWGVLNFDIAVHIAERGFGGADVSGTIVSIETLGSMVACLVFGLCFARLGRSYSIIPWAVFALGYVVLYFSPNVIITTVIALLMAAVYGGGQSFYTTWLPMISKAEDMEKYMGYLVAACGIGFFASTYLVTGLQRILGTSTVTSTFPILAVLAAVLLVLSVISTRNYYKAVPKSKA